MAGQHAKALGLDFENIGHMAAQAEHALGWGMQREASAGGVVDADRRARLHRVHDHAAVHELEPCDMAGLGESGRDLLGVAIMIIERDIAGGFVMKERRAGTRGLLRPNHGGQGLDLDPDRLGGVFRLQQRLGDDEGYGIAHEAHLVGG